MAKVLFNPEPSATVDFELSVCAARLGMGADSRRRWLRVKRICASTYARLRAKLACRIFWTPASVRTRIGGRIFVLALPELTS